MDYQYWQYAVRSTVACNTFSKFYVAGQKTATLDQNMFVRIQHNVTIRHVGRQLFFRYSNQQSGARNIKII